MALFMALEENTMSDIKVRPQDKNETRAAAAAGMGVGMLLILLIGVILLLVLAWFLIRPLFFAPPGVTPVASTALLTDLLSAMA